MSMYNPDDTICAISSPHGVGGIAVIRVSGPKAIEIVNSLWDGADLRNISSHTAHLGFLYNNERSIPLDQCVAIVYKAPRTFTGQDVVELNIHGSKWLQREMLSVLGKAGCRLALPGEFTRRAVSNGRLDLTQAEGIADLIASSSKASHRMAIRQMRGGVSQKLSLLRDKLIDLSSLLELELDFSEEDVVFADRDKLKTLTEYIVSEIKHLYSSFSNGSAIKDGIPIAIVGATNAGKSSLLNRLLQDERAIVSDIHGTTRDTIEETLEIGDYLFRFIDTAGLRKTNDPIELIGINRSLEVISKASIILKIIDLTQNDISNDIELPQNADVITVYNKVDLVKSEKDIIPSTECVYISALTGIGIDRLTDLIVKKAQMLDETREDNDSVMITNLRQAQALEKALESINALINGLDSQLETDLLAQHLRETIYHLSTLTGTITTPDILNTIFSRFCIGK